MQTITTRRIGATNCRPSRITAKTTGGYNSIWSIECVPAGKEPHAWAAKELARKIGWQGEMIGGNVSNNSVVWVFTTDKRINLNVP